ncbi:MAG: hypothetical protein NTV36_01285 [Candidatus Staskawiczbacteria bacterium]|nr:hypothetical protein [Candidatus Staskawiczbacteria bacterium]
MARKIYDIKPPKVAKKVEKELKEFLANKPKKRVKVAAPTIRTVTRTVVKSAKKKTTLRPFFIVLGLIVLIVAVYLFFKLPKANVQIWPVVENLKFNQEITVDKSAETIDTEKLVVPAKYFEASKTVAQDFPATGNASNEGKASGTITISNKSDPVAPFTFKTGTRFVSDSGKLFIATEKIVVPAGKKSGSKITAGTVQATLQAVEGGDDYNIAPSNFVIPGLKGTTYYYSINATSDKAMTGGYAGKVKKVTDDDIQGAKDTLVKKANEEAIAEINKQVSLDDVLLDNAISSTTTNASTETKSGTVAEKFNYSVTVKTGALVFKKSDIEQLAKKYLISKAPEGDNFLENSFKIDYSASTVDVSGGKATIISNFSSNIYQNIDRNALAISLEGKNAEQINQVINGSIGSQVSKINVKFWPFWVTSAPKNQKAISVDLKF